MHEDVLTGILSYETIALCLIEPLYGATSPHRNYTPFRPDYTTPPHGASNNIRARGKRFPKHTTGVICSKTYFRSLRFGEERPAKAIAGLLGCKPPGNARDEEVLPIKPSLYPETPPSRHSKVGEHLHNPIF
jgi:hypothetical protein